MKVIKIIAEYNPFHKGHEYQIQQLKKLTGVDYVIISMKGNFLQRGIPCTLRQIYVYRNGTTLWCRFGIRTTNDMDYQFCRIFRSGKYSSSLTTIAVEIIITNRQLYFILIALYLFLP